MNQPASSGFNNLVLGTDLIEVARLRKAFSRYGQTFFAKMLTPLELEYCFASSLKKDAVSIHRAAGKIALKEAVSKALGTGLNGFGWGNGVNWHDIEVIAEPQRPPSLKLHGKAQQVADELKISAWRLSLSHDGHYAMATVIGLI